MRTRYSRHREMLLDVLQKTDQHPSAAWLHVELNKQDPQISLGTVYRNLDILVRQGQIQRLYMSTGPECYDFHTQPHYHIVCTACGQISDAPLEYQPQLDVQMKKMGYEVAGHQVFFIGLCPACTAPKA